VSIKYKSPTPSAAMIVPSDDPPGVASGLLDNSPIPADRVQEVVKPRSGGAGPPKDIRAVAEPKSRKKPTVRNAMGAMIDSTPIPMLPASKGKSDPKERVAEGTIRGTFSEIQALGFSINGVKLDLAMLSVLTRLGMGKKIGEAPKPAGARGKAAGIWELPLSVSFNLVKD
jgi:hypothetical protein